MTFLLRYYSDIVCYINSNSGVLSPRPLTRPHPRNRTGLIRIGDRLLKVDNQPLINKTLIEAQRLLRDGPHGSLFTTLTIEYDVNVMESVKYATGPLLLEMDRQVNEDLGLMLSNFCDFGLDEIAAAGIFIESVVTASTADRCGALNAGDQLLAIDEVGLEDWTGSLADVERLLRDARKLQILPYHTFQRMPSRNYCGQGKRSKVIYKRTVPVWFANKHIRIDKFS